MGVHHVGIAIRPELLPLLGTSKMKATSAATKAAPRSGSAGTYTDRTSALHVHDEAPKLSQIDRLLDRMYDNNQLVFRSESRK